jgi:hypothetical protein
MSIVAAGAADLLDTRGRRRVVLAQGRSEPPVAVSGLLLRDLRMLVAKHDWSNVEKITTFI